MNKQFSFSIKVNGSIGEYSFNAPVENGYVFTNYFCPNSLLQGEGNFLFQNAIPQQGKQRMNLGNYGQLDPRASETA